MRVYRIIFMTKHGMARPSRVCSTGISAKSLRKKKKAMLFQKRHSLF